MKLISRLIAFAVLLFLVFMAIYLFAVLINGRVVISGPLIDDDFVPLPTAGPVIVSNPSAAPCSISSLSPVAPPGVASARYPGGNPCDK